MLTLYQLCDRATRLVAPNKPLDSGKASEHPLYHRWASMIYRCYDPNAQQYKDWGGRGIYMCDEWRNNFWRFVEDMGLPPRGNYTLERINNDGPYSAENCKWIHKSEQSKNRRNCVWLTVNGERMSLKEASKRSGVQYHTLKKRLLEGYPLEAALYKGNIKKNSALFNLVRQGRA